MSAPSCHQVWFRHGSACLLGLLILFLAGTAGHSQSSPNLRALSVRLEGAITPAQADLLAESLQKAREQNFDFFVIELDTPGGLGASMRDMVKTILNAPLPVCIWVGPRGARAASAGVFLVAAGHINAMSPQTTIGAASPVSLGGQDMNSTMGQKIKNDFLSLIRGIATSRGRNAEWYEKAVDEAATLTAQEAAAQDVVDYLADSPIEALVKAGAQGFTFEDRSYAFSQQQIAVTPYTLPLRYRFLSWLLHPQIAYFLLLGGIAGLFFELSHPGAVFPGVFGAICLLLAMYALAILPTNIAGVLLLLLAFVLFLLELAITSFGLLTVGGLICLLLGSTLLFRSGFGFAPLGLDVVLPTVLLVAAFVVGVVYLVTKIQIRPRQSGEQAMIGLRGKVVTAQGDRGRIKVRGELWNASSEMGHALHEGQKVEVVGVKGLDLVVRPLTDQSPLEVSHG